MSFLRPEIAALEMNGIARIALPRINDPSVIPLWFGEGDEVTAPFIVDAARQSLARGETFYDHTRGVASLREAIRKYLQQLYNIELGGNRVSVPGSSMLGITIAAQMALSRGDEAVLVTPRWPNIETACVFAGARVVPVNQRPTAAGWMLDVADIIAAITERTRLVYVNSPCNPTGWVMPAEDQQALLEVCRERNILLLADEVYHRHYFAGDVAPSFLALAREDDPLVVVNGFSKAWAMTGWRVGWVVAPAADAQHWALASECFSTGATVFAQHGCEVAIREGEDEVQRLRKQYQEGAAIVAEALAACPGIEMVPPKGAFYAFPRLTEGVNSWDFASGLLAARDVGVAPGYTFGEGYNDYIRICFALRHERLREGLGRLVDYLKAG